MAALSAETQARNRELIAERLNWPPEALGIVRWVEGNFPGYRAWWGTGRVDQPPQEGYYAVWDDKDNHNETLYGAQADELVSAIQREMMQRAEEEAERTQHAWWR